jgi:Ca2+-binding RTX toxin-like protein
MTARQRLQADFLHILRTTIPANVGLLSSHDFLATQTSVIQDNPSTVNTDLLVSTTGNDDTLIAGGGADYLSGGAGDDILLAGSDSDIINPGAGADLVIGSTGNGTTAERDTVTYQTAPGGIVVDAGLPTSTDPFNPNIYFLWADFTSTGFQNYAFWRYG